MIEITDAEKGFRCSCNACRSNAANIEIMFATSALGGRSVISLCNDCAKELKGKL